MKICELRSFYILMFFVSFRKVVAEKPLLTPNETIVFVGNTVVFTCTISGEDVFFSWTTKPETDLEYHPKGSFNSTSGNTTTHLELEVNSTYYNQMEVTCHVLFSNGDSVKSDVSLISVQGQPNKVINESIGIHNPCTINISWTPPKSLKPLDGYVIIFNEEAINVTVNNNYILLPVNSYNLSIMAVNIVSIGPAVNVILNKSDIDTHFNLTKAVILLKESQWLIEVSIPISALCENKTTTSAQICVTNWICVNANYTENQTVDELQLTSSHQLMDSIEYSLIAMIELDNNQTLYSRPVTINTFHVINASAEVTDGKLCLNVVYRPGSTANSYHFVIDCENKPNNITNSSQDTWCTRPFNESTVCTVYFYDVVNEELKCSAPAKILKDIYVNVTIDTSQIVPISSSVPSIPNRANIIVIVIGVVFSFLFVIIASVGNFFPCKIIVYVICSRNSSCINLHKKNRSIRNRVHNLFKGTAQTGPVNKTEGSVPKLESYSTPTISLHGDRQ